MIWKNREIKTYRDLVWAVDNCDAPEEAKEFMMLYRNIDKHANDNIGYLAGYYSRDVAERIYAWFEVEHPIFGLVAPTPEQALEAGKLIAEGKPVPLIKKAFSEL